MARGKRQEAIGYRKRIISKAFNLLPIAYCLLPIAYRPPKKIIFMIRNARLKRTIRFSFKGG